MDPAVYLATAIGLAITSQVAASLARIPSLILLLPVGFVLGQKVTPDEVFGRDLLFAGVSLAVGLILFEGALTLEFKRVRDLGRPIIRLLTVTVALAWLLITVLGSLLGMDLRVALLVGAILVVTGPTVINPILRILRPTRRVSQLLRWEGIVVDPFGAMLAVLVYTAVVTIDQRNAWGSGLTTVGVSVAVALVMALVVGMLLTFLMRRHVIPDFLNGVLLLGATVATLVASNAVAKESGLLAVTLLGLILANQQGLHLAPAREFMEHLQVLFVGALFIMLAGRVTPTELLDVAPIAGLFVLGLVLVVRPLSVHLGLLGTDTTMRERTLIAAMAPRGIVAAAVASIFALEFHDSADGIAEQAEKLALDDPQRAAELAEFAATLAGLAGEVDSIVPLVFVVIVATVAIYGLGIGRLAERLGLATVSPRGVMFSGANTWLLAAAGALHALKVPVLFVERSGYALMRARHAGLRTEAADILSEYAVEEMDLTGIKSFLAATPDDDTNAIASSAYARALGRANAFQIQRREPEDGNNRTGRASHLTSLTAFDPPLTLEELDARWRSGARVHTATLDHAMTWTGFRAAQPQAVLLFVQRPTATVVAHSGMTKPVRGDTVIFLGEPWQSQPAAPQSETAGAQPTA